ncbi:hypothetical protein QAD02_017436 [Eretmocerus hayati]|uniref:Uncharacterized protein n=1 Tax=Eretmocerus hayati TaxID=131215 RepID=A0ACC2PEB1_9HYME|nr:hypothetical protein QAD02_017436 [Eretmocerus hayati]
MSQNPTAIQTEPATGTFKRPSPPSTVSQSSQEIITEEMEQTEEASNINKLPESNDGFISPRRKRTNKKRKHEDKSVTRLESEKELLKSKEALGKWDFTLDFPKFQIFMEEARNSKNVHELAANISCNASDLENIIDALYPCTTSSTLKAQFTRTKNKLNNQPVTDTENEADCSS